jgi:cysteinyl-tRNA synthetase
VKLYNTMSRSKEELVPLTPGQVRMYVCGVTVYDFSHIGHARSALVFDVLRRYLRFRGYRVTFVRNFTDVDDRIIRRANEAGVAASEISERYIAAEREDMAALGILKADVEPKATEHIPEMVALIERLIARGVAYTVDGDVYFEIRRFPPYGKLSGKNLEDLLAGARVEVDERKRDPRDFALWKAAKPGEPSWPSPWGPGRPGWHIECSAMAMRYLGESFDVHGGGEDLIFPHHECEVAQSEAATDRPFSRYWIHNGFVNMGKEKMSKSLGNTLLIRELVKRHDPDAIRLFFMGTHYRNPVEWSEERVQESARAMERFTRLLGDALAASASTPAPALPARYAAFRAQFEAAMDDDLNTPQALGVLFEMARALHEERERAQTDPAARGALAAGVAELRALGGALGLFERRADASAPPREVEQLVAERVAARARRDFRRSDELRAEIAARGWAVEDTAAGPRLSRKDG